jgi:hypothetical protein
MGLLDEAIREHLDLMRRHGANEAEIARREAEALGPVLREGEAPESGSTPLPAAEGESALPYDRAAEAGLTGESDIPSFEWEGSSGSEPEVPSFVSPEPVRHPLPEPDGAESPADAEVASDPMEAYGVVEPEPAAEDAEFAVEPGVPEAEVRLQEDRSAELSPEPPITPEPPEKAVDAERSEEGGASEPSEEGAVPEPPEEAAAEPEDSLDLAPPTARQPSQSASSYDPAPSASIEPPAEPALPEGQTIEPPVPTEADDRSAEAAPLEDETAFRPAPAEGDLEASHEPDSSESFPGLGTEAAAEPALPPPDQEPREDEATAFDRAATPEPPPEVEDLPPESGTVTPEAAPLSLGPEDLPPEQEPLAVTAGEVVEEPPVDRGPGEEPPEPPIEEPPIEEPPIEEPPFVAGEEEAWREAGEAPGETSDSLPEPPLGGASSAEDLGLHSAPAVEPDAVLEPADEPPLDERPLPAPAPDAELPAPEPLDALPGEPLDPPAEPPPHLPSDSEAARGFFDETAEYERPSRDERSPTADPDFEE